MRQQTLKLEDKNLPREGSIARFVIKKEIYGGSLGYRKLKRPLSTKKPVNVVFKMNDVSYKKSGGFRRNPSEINKKLFFYLKRFSIQNYKHSINSNHIHLICKLKDKKDMAKFLKAFTGSISLYFYKKFGLKKIWNGRPFTRLVTWGREFKAVCRYILKNFREVVGFESYTPRANRNYAVLERWQKTGAASRDWWKFRRESSKIV